jgi:SAM-dependent methyltransferase
VLRRRFAHAVIEHTTRSGRAVAEVCRVAAPGGIVVITVPNRVWKPAVWVANAFKLRPYGGYENWVGDRPLRRWIDAAGLSVETQLGFNLLPHTRFCRPAFDGIDRLSSLHPG